MYFTLKDNSYFIKKELSLIKNSENNSNEQFVECKELIENVMSDRIVGKYEYIDLYGLMQKVMFKRVVSDAEAGSSVVKLSNGNLTYVYPSISTQTWSNQVSLVSDYSKSNGIYFLYAQAPWRIDDNASLPFYIKDNLSDVNKKYLDELKTNDVNFIDLSNELPGTSNEWFFSTDHHWNINTAFDAYEIITRNIALNVDISFDERNVTDFTKNVYKNIFLGTYGKRVGMYYGGLDDYTYILPNFETGFTVTNFRNPGKITNRLISDFKSSFTYNEYIDVNEIDREMSTYYAYGEGTKAEIRSVNNIIESDKKILILKDSFADPVYPFIALNFKEMRVLDIRRYQNIKLKTYIDEFTPDVILFLHTPTSLYDETLVKFKME